MMKLDSPKKRLFSHVKLTIFPALLTIITFFIFGVVDLYFPNQEELWFSVWEVLAPCAMAALVVLVVVLLVAVLLGKISSKVLGVFVAILFGLGLGFYLQGNLMPMDYGVLDGKSIQWEQYTLYRWSICKTAASAISSIPWPLCSTTGCTGFPASSS